MIHVSSKPLPPRPGVQARGRRSFESVLAAAEELLSERLFEQVTMAEIAERSGLAVGTVYQRFPSKESLIPALFRRHNTAVTERIGALMEDLPNQPRLRARIERLVGFAVDYHVRHRGLLRTLTTFVRAHPEAVDESLFDEREAMYAAVASLLAGDGSEIARDDPLEAALFALGVVNSVCREQILFSDVSPLSRRRGMRASLVRRLSSLVERELAGELPNPIRR